MALATGPTVSIGPAPNARPSRCHDLYMPGVAEPYAYTCVKVAPAQ